MFVQVVQARVKDPAAVDEALDRWIKEVKPGSIGWLGSTSGITKDGTLIAVVRFQDEKSAQANSNRPEQDAWFKEFSKNVDGDVTFFDSTEVEEFAAGGSDDAGFVQIISGTTKDKKRAKEIDEEMEAATAGQRPDVIGGVSAWNGNRFFQTIYFTSEAEARANEAKGFEGDAKAAFEEMQALTEDVKFFDLSDPRMYSP